MSTKESLSTYLGSAISDEASDIFFHVGAPASAKFFGEIHPIGDHHCMTEEEIQAIAEKVHSKAKYIPKSMDVKDTGYYFFIYRKNKIPRKCVS